MTRIKSLAFLAFLACACFSQPDTVFPTIDLKLGESGAPSPLLVSIPGTGTAVVFERLPHTAMCPANRPGDFALKKMNPKPGQAATIEHISSICTMFDSISINTEPIYEIYTPTQEVYYMRLIGRVEGKVKVQVSKTIPTSIERAAPRRKAANGQDHFDASGTKQSPSSDWNSKLLFQR